jgi:DNA repair exonuclease SbcCD ATPase subunit
MKILNLVAENVKRISVVEITPEGNLVQVTGPNGSGKSSVLDAIMWCLAGTKDVPSQPIRKGQSSAKVRIDLGDLVVTRKFTASGSTLTVENKDGAVYKSPQAVLDKLLGTIAFDPLAFARQRPREQFETLRTLVSADVDFAAIEKANAADYEARAALNREAKNVRARVEAEPEPAAELPAEKISARQIHDEINAARRHNRSIDHAREVRAGGAKKVQELRHAAASDRRQAAALLARAEQAEAELALREQELLALPPLPDPVDDAAIGERLLEAERVNAAIDRRDHRAQLVTLAERAEQDVELLTRRMAERERTKREAVAAAKLPVDGIGFGDGEVLLNGVPFEQASDAERLRASCAIAMAMNPKLRVLRVRDGSLLDENGVRLLAEMADAHDCQVWLERVSESGKVGVVMEDGHVKA